MLRFRNKDKRRAVMKLLEDAEWRAARMVGLAAGETNFDAGKGTVLGAYYGDG